MEKNKLLSYSVFAFILLGSFALFNSASAAGIAFDATSTTGWQATTSSVSVSHKISGINTALISFVYVRHTTDNHITSVKYNGVDLTFVSSSSSGIPQSGWQGTYILLNPPTGTHNLVVTADATYDAIAAVNASYTGVSQSGQPEAYNFLTCNASSCANTISTLTKNAWVIAGGRSDTGTITAGASTTLRYSDAGNSSIGILESASNPINPARSVTINENIGGTDNVYLNAISLAPAGIVFDATSTSGWQATTSSVSTSHTVTGNNPILLSWVYVRHTTGNHIKSVKYNGTSMTLVNSSTTSTPQSGWQGLYSLLNPTVGTHNVVVTTNGTFDAIADVNASYANVKQTGQPDTQKANVCNGISCSISLTTSADKAWVIGGGRSDTGTITAGASTTLRYSDDGNTSIGIVESAFNPITPSSTVTLNENIGITADNVYLNAISLVPFYQ